MDIIKRRPNLKIVSSGPKGEVKKASILKGVVYFCFAFLFFRAKFSPLSTLSLFDFFVFAVISFLFWFSYRSMISYQYSYWGFNLTIFFLYLFSFSLDGGGTILFLFGLLLFALENYIMASPLFFPQVRWWEYDFRYRGDLRVQLVFRDDRSEARLTDIRRGAACLLSFTPMPIGEDVTIVSENKNIQAEISASIASRKEPIAGRGFHYGVLVERKSGEGNRAYEKFRSVWLERKHRSLRHKFRRNRRPSS